MISLFISNTNTCCNCNQFLCLGWDDVSVLLGMTSAYFLGGVVYDKYEINGVAIVEIIASSFELLSLFLYVLLDNFFPEAPSLDEKSSNDNVVDGDDNSHTLGTDDNGQNQEGTKDKGRDVDVKSEAQDPTNEAPHQEKRASFWNRRGSVFGRGSVFRRGSVFGRGSILDRIFQFSSNEIKPALDSFGTSDIGANFINYVFVSEYHFMYENCCKCMFWVIFWTILSQSQYYYTINTIPFPT